MNKSSCPQRGETLELTLGIAPFDHQVMPLHVPQLPQPLPEGRDADRERGRGAASEEAYAGGVLGWLRRNGA